MIRTWIISGKIFSIHKLPLYLLHPRMWKLILELFGNRLIFVRLSWSLVSLLTEKSFSQAHYFPHLLVLVSKQWTFTLHLTPVLVSCGCHNKMPQIWLNTGTIIFSQFMRSDIRNCSIGRTALSLVSRRICSPFPDVISLTATWLPSDKII